MQSLPNLYTKGEESDRCGVRCERNISFLLPNGRLISAVLLQLACDSFGTDAQPSYTSRRPLSFFLTSDSFELMMFESESPASDLDLQSFQSLNVEDVLSKLLSSESWHLVFRSSSFNVDDTHQSFPSSWFF